MKRRLVTNQTAKRVQLARRKTIIHWIQQDIMKMKITNQATLGDVNGSFNIIIQIPIQIHVHANLTKDSED